MFFAYILCIIFVISTKEFISFVYEIGNRYTREKILIVQLFDCVFDFSFKLGMYIYNFWLLVITYH